MSHEHFGIKQVELIHEFKLNQCKKCLKYSANIVLILFFTAEENESQQNRQEKHDLINTFDLM